MEEQLTEGTVVAVRGSVVDVRFDSKLPEIRNVLRTGENGRIQIEVMAQLNARCRAGHLADADPGIGPGLEGHQHGRTVHDPRGQRASREGVQRLRGDHRQPGANDQQRSSGPYTGHPSRSPSSPPSRRSSKRGSRPSMSSARWNEAARPVFSAAPASGRRCS